jgi:hypothetical protein
VVLERGHGADRRLVRVEAGFDHSACVQELGERGRVDLLHVCSLWPVVADRTRGAVLRVLPVGAQGLDECVVAAG